MVDKDDKTPQPSENEEDLVQQLEYEKEGGIQKQVSGKPLNMPSQEAKPDPFPGKPRKTTKENTGFKPDPDVEASH